MLFQIYGENAGWQLFGWLMVFVCLIAVNEIARRSKAGGIFCFLILPAALTVYFIAIQVGAAKGAEWALNNDTYVHMNGWFHYAKLYAATAGCIGFTMLKYHWGIGKKDWFKIFPFAIVAINILIAVGSDFESGVALLLAPTFAAMLWNKGGWIQNRANTLALWCMFAQVFPLFQEQGKFAVLPVLYKDGVMDAAVRPTAVNPTMQGVIALLALAANVICLAVIIKRAKEQKKNPYTNEIFTDQRDYKLAMARAEKQ